MSATEGNLALEVGARFLLSNVLIDVIFACFFIKSSSLDGCAVKVLSFCGLIVTLLRFLLWPRKSGTRILLHFTYGKNFYGLNGQLHKEIPRFMAVAWQGDMIHTTLAAAAAALGLPLPSAQTIRRHRAPPLTVAAAAYLPTMPF